MGVINPKPTKPEQQATAERYRLQVDQRRRGPMLCYLLDGRPRDG